MVPTIAGALSLGSGGVIPLRTMAEGVVMTPLERIQCPNCERVRGVRWRQRTHDYICSLCGHIWKRIVEEVTDAN